MPAPTSTLIPDDTWIRVLILQRILEDLGAGLGIDPRASIVPGAERAADDIVSLLEQLTSSIAARLRRPVEVVEREMTDDEVARIESGFVFYEYVDTERRKRFDLELWRARSLPAPLIRRLLYLIPIDQRTAIEAETHGMGYHIHYLVREDRTDVIFLFNPVEPEVVMPILYWERHGEGRSVRVWPPPDRFGRSRRREVYGACRELLDHNGKVVLVEVKPELWADDVSPWAQASKYRALWSVLEDRPVVEIRPVVAAPRLPSMIPGRMQWSTSPLDGSCVPSYARRCFQPVGFAGVFT